MPRIAYKTLNIKGPRLALIDTANTIIEDYQNGAYPLAPRTAKYSIAAECRKPRQQRNGRYLSSAGRSS